MRILCLHGMGSNASIFEAQSHQILQPLRTDGHQFVFVDGLIPFEPPDERLKAMYEPPYLAYYTSKAGFDEAVDLITEHLEEDGPFDGVFAFSQGCHLAAAFMSALAQNELGSQVFRFAVFIGASPRLEYDVEGDKRQRRLHVPILHVIGRNDEHRLESLEFVAMHSADSDPVVLEHDGGHHIPIDVSVRYTITRYMSGQVNGGAMAA